MTLSLVKLDFPPAGDEIWDILPRKQNLDCNPDDLSDCLIPDPADI